ncbi:MAG: COX15/CtaA family protein [Vicinamibacteria bacterium]
MASTALLPRSRPLATLAWGLLAYTILVILWGAFVRATGAGAGCGSHWPLCNGEVIPRSPSAETVIEFTHRLSSGLLGILVVLLNVLAFRSFPAGHQARKAAFVSFLFVVAEALVGAGLVRFEWVASNASAARVYVMAFHLVNTFLLLGAMAIAAWLMTRDRVLLLRGPGVVLGPLVLALLGVLLVGSSGATTALGDTLVLNAGIKPEDSPVVAKLVATRFYHPTLAIGVFLLLVGVVLWLRPRVRREAHRYGRWLLAVFGAQLLLGASNVFLMAPVWMQIVHLAVSDVLWVLLVLMTAEALSREAGQQVDEG